ncbi:hypothetical protein Leryth_023411 [Lithospermum erythrorhizon]|nr:hypothetical protein Leryth_023411 [Lithospermum erythrorhizon]
MARNLSAQQATKRRWGWESGEISKVLGGHYTTTSQKKWNKKQAETDSMYIVAANVKRYRKIN